MHYFADPTLFLAHCKAHKPLTQSQPCKELKMPRHRPFTQLDEILIISILNINKISTINNHDILKTKEST